MRKWLNVILLMNLYFPLLAFAGWGSPNYGTGSPFQVGVENNGRPIYLCRSYYQNSLTNGKTWPDDHVCNIPYGGQEIRQFSYEVFFGNLPGRWESFRGYLPPNAFLVGRDSDGAPLFLCRKHFDGGIQPGKTKAGTGVCNIGYAGSEILVNQYQVFLKYNR